MAEHMIESRILLRYDTLSNWLSSTVILKQGEAAIAVSPFKYTIGETNNRPENTPPAVGIKIGDGYHYFSELPWVQGVAGDVYSWAKQQTKPSYSANEIQGLATLIQYYINELNPGGGSGGGSGGDTPAEAREYRLAAGVGANEHKYYLESKTASEVNWIADEVNYIDLTEFAAVLDWLGDIPQNYWGINGYTIDKINSQLALVNYTDYEDITQVVTAVNQNNGRISVTHRPLSADNMSGTLPVSHGGTGRISFDYDSVLIGNGSGALTTKSIDSVLTSNNNLATNRAIVTYINNATAGLVGAMHYKGEATVEITNNSNVNPKVDGYNFSQALPGDVITFNFAEYIWTGSHWRLLGDEGSYVIKGTITDRDIADDAEISQSKIANLPIDLNSKVDKVEGKELSSNDYTDEEKQKLEDIEAYAEHNAFQHIFVNGTEVFPTTVDGKDRSLSLRVSALTEEEEDKIAGIEVGAQVNRIEHIFLNDSEVPIGTVNGIPKSVNIQINEFTNTEKLKLAGIEAEAQVNSIEEISINGITYYPNAAKQVAITLDPSVFHIDAVAGARVPNGQQGYEDVSIDPTTNKLELSRIAKTGNVTDLLQSNDEYITLYCGTSTEII